MPPEENWPEILDLDLGTTTALSVKDFLSRAKFGSKLDAACKIKAGYDKLEKCNAGLSIDVLSDKNKEELEGQHAVTSPFYLIRSKD